MGLEVWVQNELAHTVSSYLASKSTNPIPPLFLLGDPQDLPLNLILLQILELNHFLLLAARLFPHVLYQTGEGQLRLAFKLGHLLTYLHQGVGLH